VVRVYCGLHGWESGLVVVAPTRWFTRLERPGAFAIADVPAGRYRVRAWSETGRAEPAVVEVRPGGATSLELRLDGPAR
jgi:hypothetical protein